MPGENLSCVGFGKIGNEIHGARDLIAGQGFPTISDNLFSGGLFSFSKHNHGLNLLTPLVVGHSDNRGLKYLFVPAKDCLDFGGIDVFPPTNDHVDFSINQVVEAILVHPCHVA